jgi:DUF4097 and DUF4098 domain-containing protein YvlB
MRIPILSGLLALALAAAAPVRADEWSKKYSVTGKPDLRVDANDGSIEIHSSDEKEIEARVVTAGWRIPQDVRVTESQNGDYVKIEVRAPHMNFNLFWSGQRSLRIELRVPRTSDLDVHTGDGHITSEPVSGRIRLDTGDGHVTVDGLAGDVRLHTGDGRIEGAHFDGSLDADTGDGRISVRGRFDSLNLKTGDGSIESEVESGSIISTSWSLRSGDGNIVLRMPEGLGADLDAHTGDGHITLDFPVTVSGPLSTSTIRGKMGGGGSPLLIHTGDGHIRIQRS